MISLAEQLRDRGRSMSKAMKLLAQQKSLRQSDNPEGRDDLYGYPRPEETLEWKAADRIDELESQIIGSKTGDHPGIMELLKNKKPILILGDDGPESLSDFIDKHLGRDSDTPTTIEIKTIESHDQHDDQITDGSICRSDVSTLGTLDDWLKEEGIHEEVTAVAEERVVQYLQPIDQVGFLRINGELYTYPNPVGNRWKVEKASESMRALYESPQGSNFIIKEGNPMTNVSISGGSLSQYEGPKPFGAGLVVGHGIAAQGKGVLSGSFITTASVTPAKDPVKDEAIKLLSALYHATLSETGFYRSVQLDTGKEYPWPAFDLIKSKIEDFLKTNSPQVQNTENKPTT